MRATMIDRQMLLICFLMLGIVTSCARPTNDSVQSFLAGNITVRGEADTTDFSGFQVVVLSETRDTLANAITDREGNFSTDVQAPQRGIYPLRINRYGLLMAESEFLTAEDDSAFLRLAVPLGERPLVIRSNENSAWAAYRNAKAAYNSSVLELANSQNLNAQSIALAALAASEVLWSIKGVFPKTMAAELAASESVMMLEGRADSLLIDRGKEIGIDQLGYLNVVRSVRRAISRRNGVEEAVNYLRDTLPTVEDEEARATLHAEIVQAYQDSSLYDAALLEARNMQRTYRKGALAEFAERIVYELDVLRPGYPVPEFNVSTLVGESVSSASIGNETAILEFFDPVSEAFSLERQERDSLISLASARGIRYLAISVNPDPDINEAFFDRPGLGEIPAQIVDSEELAAVFNVANTPRRILISDSKIIGKYDGRAAGALFADVAIGNINQ